MSDFIFFPEGSVRVYFTNDDTTLAGAAYVTLPIPTKRQLKWIKQVKTQEVITGEIKSSDRGFRPELTLEFHSPESTYWGNLVMLANYSGQIVVQPFYTGSSIDLSLLMKIIEADVEPFGGKNLAAVFKFRMQAMKLYTRVYSPDDLFLAFHGYRSDPTTGYWITPQSVYNSTTGNRINLSNTIG